MSMNVAVGSAWAHTGNKLKEDSFLRWIMTIQAQNGNPFQLGDRL